MLEDIMMIDFKEINVKQYLDNCIKKWRLLRRTAELEENKLMAEYYIDAFQSVRISLFGATLLVEEPDIVEV